MRRHWIDNLRWVTILLVLLYHVIYFYNNKGVFGGVGGFGDGPQYQDILLYALYPWFMPLLFLLAGVSARYALVRQTASEWFKSRTRKLLVPSTIGLFLLHWITGYFNTHLGGNDVLAAVPQPVKFVVWSLNGTGPLWFIQVLWLLSLTLLIIRRIDSKDKFWSLCGKANMAVIVLLGMLLFWLGEQTLIQHPRLQSADGLFNLYKPLFYIIPFLMGYFLFSHDEVQEQIAKAWMPLMGAAMVTGITLVATTFGQDYTSPQYLGSVLCNVYGYLMCLAMIGWFKSCFDSTNRFASYMTHSSFGIYIVHYVVIATVGYLMKYNTQLPPIVIYTTLIIAVFSLSPALYEVLHRIPIVRWCLFGEKAVKQ